MYTNKSYKIKKYKPYGKSHKKKFAVATVVILCAAMLVFAAITVFNPSVAKVENVSAAKVLANEATLKWNSAISADGYYVYERADGRDGFSRIATLKGKDKNTFTVKKLEQSSGYDFYVTAFKKAHETVESNASDVLRLLTPPDKVTLTEAASAAEGRLSVKWEKNKTAYGYQLQYTDGESFKKAETLKLSAKENSAEIKKLKTATAYKVRVRAYIKDNKKKVAGEWSDERTVTIAEKFSIPDRIDPNKPMVALTFDDGPAYNDAPNRILDTLEKYGAKATFFMVGKNATEHPDNVKRKLELGMELGNHTWDHTHYGKKVKRSDISKASEAIFDICGQYPTAFRSPGGMTTDKILNECKKENMTAYYWSIDTEDWRTRDAKSTYKKVIKNVKDGDIILMHEIYGSTADAVKKLVPKLIKKGYQLVTCRELISAKTGAYPEVGKQYYKG